MAVSLDSARLTVDVYSVTKNPLDQHTPRARFEQAFTNAFTNGSGADQAHTHWEDQRTLNATTAEELDLQALAAGPFGTVVFTDIRAILIVNTSTAGALEIGGAAANAWEQFVKAAGDIVQIKAGGSFLWIAPKDAGGVVDATHKQLKINNPAGSAQTYKIFILGTTS